MQSYINQPQRNRTRTYFKPTAFSPRHVGQPRRGPHRRLEGGFGWDRVDTYACCLLEDAEARSSPMPPAPPPQSLSAEQSHAWVGRKCFSWAVQTTSPQRKRVQFRKRGQHSFGGRLPPKTIDVPRQVRRDLHHHNSIAAESFHRSRTRPTRTAQATRSRNKPMRQKTQKKTSRKGPGPRLHNCRQQLTVVTPSRLEPNTTYTQRGALPYDFVGTWCSKAPPPNTMVTFFRVSVDPPAAATTTATAAATAAASPSRAIKRQGQEGGKSLAQQRRGVVLVEEVLHGVEEPLPVALAPQHVRVIPVMVFRISTAVSKQQPRQEAKVKPPVSDKNA